MVERRLPAHKNRLKNSDKSQNFYTLPRLREADEGVSFVTPCMKNDACCATVALGRRSTGSRRGQTRALHFITARVQVHHHTGLQLFSPIFDLARLVDASALQAAFSFTFSLADAGTGCLHLGAGPGCWADFRQCPAVGTGARPARTQPARLWPASRRSGAGGAHGREALHRPATTSRAHPPAR